MHPFVSCDRRCDDMIFFCIVFLFKLIVLRNVYDFKKCDFMTIWIKDKTGAKKKTTKKPHQFPVLLTLCIKPKKEV